MALSKEPRNIDLIIQSKPWTEAEQNELSEIIRNSKKKSASIVKRRKNAPAKQGNKQY